MSGFFAVFARTDEPIDPALLARMETSLAYLGGDARGQVSLARCGLGQVSLWTTPEQAGSTPPFRLPDAGLWLVGDVRLDNREELADALSIAEAAGLPDEVFILHAYARWGEDCTQRLLGDFAFALWDERARGLFVARDHFGVRSVCYAETSRHVLVASHSRALFAAPELSRRIDDFMVADFLTRQYSTKHRTFFEGVFRLPPGNQLRVTERGLNVHTYWQLDPTRRVHLPSNQDYVDQFRELFQEAVRARLRTRSAPALMLSGGLDSAGILGAAQSLRPDLKLRCFSARFPDFPECDEGSFLALWHQRGQAEYQDVAVDRGFPLGTLEDVQHLMQAPLAGPNSWIFLMLARRVRQEGAVTLLDGLDGDSVVDHGWRYPNVLWHQGKVVRALREFARIRRRLGGTWREYAVASLVGLEVESLLDLYGLYAPWTRQHPPALMSRGLSERAGWFASTRRTAKASARPVTDFHKLHHRHINSGVITVLAENANDLSAAVGIDARHPYFDRRLMEFCLAIPAEQRLRDGWDRWIQRRAFEGWIPKEIQVRIAKSLWEGPLQRQFLRGDAARLRSLASQPRVTAYVDAAAMGKTIEVLAFEEGLPAPLPRPRLGDLLRTGWPRPELMDLWMAGSFGSWLSAQPG